ncbi:MAG: UDP-N-acetylmuramoyl-tripeptide--D-alanyl-D-alanine ligase [Phycisphaera sp.]|nr:UDP-N-acetylmuramoyl-tripeptide--D-alanyl-D-alanine ligase [Phycisphaera sp.]
MRAWTLETIRHVTHGRWLVEPRDPQAVIHTVNTDTRSLEKGQAFFAIPGETFDGHDYLTTAMDRGAAVCVVCKPDTLPGGISLNTPVLCVNDTVGALQDLAVEHRDFLAKSRIPVVGVVGSNGKTTTRSLIHTTLSATLGTGHQSPKSFNNHLGVPLTLLGVDPDTHRFAVVEVGTNHPGEIDALSRIVRPDGVVVTSIGHEHIGYFGSLAGVANEEASILAHLKTGGVAFVPDSCEQLDNLRDTALKHSVSLITIGQSPDAVVRLKNTTPLGLTQGTRIELQGGPAFTLPLPGAHNVTNALLALAVAKHLGGKLEVACLALESAKPAPMRSQVVTVGQPPHHITLIHDAYNANPDSVRAALQTLRDHARPDSAVVVLGDMLELGNHAPDLHRSIGQTLADMGHTVREAVLIGKLSLFTAESLLRHWPAQRVHTFAQWNNDIPDHVANLLRDGDTLLLKASRGMALERIVPALEARFADTMGRVAADKRR